MSKKKAHLKRPAARARAGSASRPARKKTAAPAPAAPYTRPTLAKGEVYAGVVLSKNGAADHHLVLLPGQANDVTWNNAREWAAAQGGELPSRREQAILFGNAPEEFERRWYWSAEQHAECPEYAWLQTFSDGGQHYLHTGIKYRARAVRRVPIQ